MSSPRLNIKILEKIIDKTGLAEKTVRKNISLMKRQYPNCTSNAIAQLYSSQHGFSVMQKLSKEDKESLPNHNIEKAVLKLKEKKNNKKEQILEFIHYDTDNHFQEGHVKEVNRAYTYKCYTAAYILTRKVIENLILDILRHKFPAVSLENKELYYDVSRRRYKDFEIILTNLFDKRHEFNVNCIKPIERLYEKAKRFKDRANVTTHSWFYLIESKKEIDDLEINVIIELIKAVQKES